MTDCRLKFENLEEFVKYFNPSNRHKRKESWSSTNPDRRWRKLTYDEITALDKTSLDIFWLKDESQGDLENLPDPDVLAQEIMENLEEGLERFKTIMNRLN
ncbi:MAG TPA: hypothetical protein VI583_08875 [Cyclobacteriaceae bacterium]|nr:hypothetical protein [Cyclobacteriaceae bacterium]